VADNYWRGELDDLLEVENGLSPWEIEFVEDMDRSRRNPNFRPTEKQVAKVAEIWDQVCG